MSTEEKKNMETVEKNVKTPKVESSQTEKTRDKSLLLKVLVWMGVFAAVVVLAMVSGLFGGLRDTLSGVFACNERTIFKLLIMLTFMILLKNLILLILKNVQSQKGRVNTLVTLLDSLVRYATIIICVCWGLSIIGVNVSTIFASVGIVALIIGFGAESLIADVVTGIFILFENQYNVGDIIEIGGFRGEVARIGIRTISLRDTGGNEKIINNSEVKNVLNRSDFQSKAVCDIGIPYEADLDEVDEKIEKILKDIKNAHQEVFIGDIRYLGVESLGDSSVVIRVVADVAEKDIYAGRRVLNKEMKTRLEQIGLSVPYPRVNIHQ